MKIKSEYSIPDKTLTPKTFVIPKVSRPDLPNINGIVYSKDDYDAAIIQVAEREYLPIIRENFMDERHSIGECFSPKYEDIIGVIREIGDECVVAEFWDDTIDEAIFYLSNGALMAMGYIANYSDNKNALNTMQIFGCYLTKMPEIYARKCLKDLRGISINEYTAKFYGLAHK